MEKRSLYTDHDPICQSWITNAFNNSMWLDRLKFFHRKNMQFIVGNNFIDQKSTIAQWLSTFSGTSNFLRFLPNFAQTWSVQMWIQTQKNIQYDTRMLSNSRVLDLCLNSQLYNPPQPFFPNYINSTSN